ncbi:RagB/SusD family nutrient uptake outer membrane protein [Mucilaginibacter roseus]|uniref:RagB/SusD family nutrient uptake outer membrane protein n=1 Tax=Mucilaginibacter roseus TaxID=1528868 RepID=A0ABS8U7Y3_9SPHI|nr:RagB/SusD family nutrient uptake outer membrane protein [Mucilaginibacter roseus]MCD8742275.1 RagB/SusD family nutrient uptake outer membrane protein [Mucilaginibacter roseus]
MKNRLKIYAALMVIAVAVTSCAKDLNLKPTNDVTADVVYATPAGYKGALAKVYGSFAQTGNSGAGSGDLGGIDAGTSDFFRLYFGAQELSTDEAVCAWLGDPGVSEIDQMTWSSTNLMLQGLYTRSIYQITLANEFIRESTDAKLASRNISGNDATEIKYYVAEARFLRAFQYWVLLDLYGNPPFITEADNIGKDLPKQTTRAALFSYVESELKAVETLLKDPRTNEYGRADKAAAWALLARLYLNAQVYTGTEHNGDAITYANKVIGAGYTLHSQYKNLFLADNDLNNPETIFAIAYDGVKTQNYGGSTYLINAAINADMKPAEFGVPNGGWGGNRTRQNLPNKFTNANDKRSMFFGEKREVDDLATFTDGLAVTKFKNITQAGAAAPSVGGTFCSMDIPLFRLAEMYMIYAEATARGGNGGNQATAITYLNNLRTRAYGNSSGNVSSLVLNDLLDEYSREFYWEGHRRTDLVRFGKYTDASYLWPYKGGVKAGRGVESYRNLFPLPSTDVIANPNLKQNPGY